MTEVMPKQMNLGTWGHHANKHGNMDMFFQGLSVGPGSEDHNRHYQGRYLEPPFNRGVEKLPQYNIQGHVDHEKRHPEHA